MPTNSPPSVPKAMGYFGATALGLAGLAIGFILGYGSGRVSTGTPLNPLAPRPSDGLAEAERRLQESGILPPTPSETHALTGEVVAVAAGKLTFDAELRVFDPIGTKGLPVRRTAELTATTSVVRLEQKSGEEFAREQDAFNRALGASGPGDSTPPTPPTPYKEAPATIDDIAPGDTVTVEAESDILTSSSFEARRIIIAPRLALPPETSPTEPASP